MLSCRIVTDFTSVRVGNTETPYGRPQGYCFCCGSTRRVPLQNAFVVVLRFRV